MDGLDSFDSGFDAGGTGTPEQSAESARESSEKQREKSSKALAGIQKSRRDESKARKHSDALAGILVELLRDPKYDRVVDGVLALLKHDVPSVAVIAFSAISFEPGLRVLIDHLSMAVKIPMPAKRETPEAFDEKTLRDDERAYINLWVEVLFSALTSDVSVLLTKKLMGQLDSSVRQDIVGAMARFFEIYLSDIGIAIAPKHAEAYAGFILEQVGKRLGQTKLEEF